MRRIMRFELERAFRNKWLLISIAVGTLLGVLDLSMYHSMNAADGSHSLIQAWIGTNYQYAYNVLYYVLLPLIACLPYAGSYFADMNAGYDKNICIRTSRSGYIVSKMTAVYLSAFTAVTAPLAIDLFLAAGMYPNNKPERLSFLVAGVIDCQLFPEIFELHPVGYCILFILIDGLFAGMLGLISVCVSKWVGSRFSAIMAPFVVYVLTGVIFVGSAVGNWSVMEMVNPIQTVVTLWYQMLICLAVPMAVCIAVVWLYSRRRDIL